MENGIGVKKNGGSETLDQIFIFLKDIFYAKAKPVEHSLIALKRFARKLSYESY